MMGVSAPLLRSFSFERLLFWYHDQYAKREAERRDRLEVERFLHDVVRWYEDGYDQMAPEEHKQKRLSLLFGQPEPQQKNPPKTISST